MTAFTRTQPDATWVSGFAPGTFEYASLDSKIKRALNGDDGGAWAPSSALNLSNLQVTGPFVVFSAEGVLATSGTARFKLGDGDWPVLGPGHAYATHTLKFSFADWLDFDPQVPQSFLNDQYAALQAVAPTLIQPGSSNVVRFYKVLRLHDASTATAATITFRVGYDHVAPPTQPPKARVIAVDLYGNQTNLTSSAAGADADGFVSYPIAPNSGPWFDEGRVKTWTVPLDQNNIVDISVKNYLIEVREESVQVAPVATGLLFTALVATTTNIALTGAASVDGSATNGVAVLVKDQTNPTENGLYIGNSSGAWTRVPLFIVDGTGSFGHTVWVAAGNRWTGTTWALTNGLPITTGTSQIVFANVSSTTPPGVVPLGPTMKAFGNIWQEVAVTCSLIADARFQ